LDDVLPAISVDKTANSVTVVEGDDVTFTVVITNESVASDPVIIDTLNDDIYGDLNEQGTCSVPQTIQPGDNYSCEFTVTMALDTAHGDYTDVVTASGADDEENQVGDSDDATVTLVPRSATTDGSLCLFDHDLSTENREFRLLFTPDMQQWPAYKLTASNPGQYSFNVFYSGTPGEAVNFDLDIPYPFVTQGATPVAGYDGVSLTTVNGIDCFVPGTEFINTSDQIMLETYGGAETTALPITMTVPDSGFIYLNIQLGYGLRGGENRYQQNSHGDALDFDDETVTLIPNGAAATFSVSGAQRDGDTVYNTNVFKRIAGVAGMVQYDGIEPVIGANVSLWGTDRDGVQFLAGEAITDEDGWYMIEYRHKGRPSDYNIELEVMPNVTLPEGYTANQTIQLRGNASAEVSFVVPTGNAIATADAPR
jgi:hypothetical protein